MISTPTTGRSILRQEALGFFLMLLFVWVAEIAGVPHRFFGEPPGFIWQRVLFRTVIILAVWLWVHLTTRRLLRRLYHLEEYLLICSWCRKVGHEGKWLSLEEYFGSRLNTETSHGICPECAGKQFSAHHTVTRVNNPSA